ncbi:hypothetical protein HBDW_19140 [Herbaspirillum sp. DW155]|uniref:hypothetical protein n=1 Tax=Herbaspirillum sp. DW155 TaxID=3095609 RepID=UPI00308C6F8D|nr:hypothetical protein HBDW_19140 [Herbaspirillum sp. DW155]
MRLSRFTALQQGLSATARKVFAVVPIAEPWTCAQIVAEMRRQGASLDVRIVGGCIAALLSAGLVLEGKPGHYVRVKVSEGGAKTDGRAAQQVVELKKESEVTQTNAQAKQQSAIAKLGALSERAVAIGMMLKTLGDDIAKAAIEIDDDAAIREAEWGKIRQLQKLLKEIGG